MKKGDEITIEIEDLKKLGLGRAKLIPDDSNTNTKDVDEILVKNVVPGQVVKARVKKNRRKKVEAVATEILKRREDEFIPVCENFGRCGGCLYLSLPYESELKIKENYLKNSFSDYPFEKLYPSPNVEHYRNKMEYSFGNEEKDGELTLGLHERDRYYNILDANSCQLAGEDFNVIVEAVKNYFKDQDSTFYHKNTHEGFLRHLVLRRGEHTDEILVNLVTSSDGTLDEESFVECILNAPVEGKITGILHTTNDSPADAVIPEEVKCLYGEAGIRERLLDLEFVYPPFSFFQVNTEGAELLYSIVRDYTQEALEDYLSPKVYDLYCGTGTITQVLAKSGAHVLGIEIDPDAVEIARDNAERNNVEAAFITGDVLEKVKGLRRADLIVLDPPRSGIHPKALSKILELEPDYFIYVSCNPESLKNDLPEFIESGYEVLKMSAVDMFPRTPHVETVVLMSRIRD